MGERVQPREAKTAAEGAWAQKIYAFAMGVMWLCVVVLSFACLANASSAEFWRLGVIIWLPFAWWLSVLIHELGHAFASLICGWRVLAFVAGPFGYHFANRDFSFVPARKRREWEGFVLPIPRNAVVWTRRCEIAIYAAGSAVNIGTSMIILTFTGLSWESPAQNAGFNMDAIGIGFALVSFATGVGSLIPSPKGTLQTDGAVIAGIFRRDEGEWRRYRAVGYLYGLVRDQLRLRDLPRWMIEEAVSEAPCAGPEMQRAAAALSISIALDSPPVPLDRTRRMLDDFRSRYGASAWLDSCDAYFTAVWELDPSRARTLLWRGEVDDEIRPLALAAEAAVLAGEGDARRASAVLRQMREAIQGRSAFRDLTFRDIADQVTQLASVTALAVDADPEARFAET